jgi:hypothetical protein
MADEDKLISYQMVYVVALPFFANCCCLPAGNRENHRQTIKLLDY